LTGWLMAVIGHFLFSTNSFHCWLPRACCHYAIVLPLRYIDITPLRCHALLRDVLLRAVRDYVTARYYFGD
jgi:hypothetical protein